MGIGRLNIDTSGTFTGISNTLDMADVSYDLFGSTEKSTSRENAWRPFHIQNMEAVKKYAPELLPQEAVVQPAANDIQQRVQDFEQANKPGDNLFIERADGLLDSIPELQKKFPDAGFVSRDEIIASINADIDALETKAAVVENQTLPSQQFLGNLLGVGGGALTDPVNVGAMVLVPPPVKGGVAAKMAWDAGIAMLSESAIQYNAFQYKDELGRDPTFQEAVNVVLATGGGAAVLRGLGHTLVAAYKRGISSGELVDTPELREAMAHIEETQQLADDILPETKQDIDTHFAATDKAMESAAEGRPITQAEIDDVKLDTSNQQIESLDPRKINVDAETFQFKSSGNTDGVTDRLKGVDTWDSDLSGVAVVWERADGEQFIVDGHQRLALANRALDAGQDPEQVVLNARLWREVDGVSVSDARQRAAIKNIVEGTGSPIDAAKILRELGDDGMASMPPLPPNSVLVRDAKGLSNLGDDAFRAIINGVIDERYGSIVGILVRSPDEQSAIIHALSIHKPGNLNQAMIMVQDMKAAGFQRTETEDLFGGQSLTETLFKERARVIDHAMKQVRRDRQTFNVLNEQGGRIEAAGNVLNRDENLIRVSEGEAALVALSKLANTKGAVSDAIQQAAERLKAGEPIQRASADLFAAIQREAIQKHRGRVDVGEVRQASEAPSTREVIEPVETQAHTSINDEKLLADTIASDLDDPLLRDMFDQDMAEANGLLASNGDDIHLPKNIRINEAGEEVVETQTLRQAFDEIDQEKQSIDDLFICVGGGDA